MHAERLILPRRVSLAAGVLFLITYVTSIAAYALFQPVLDDPAGYIAGTGQDGRIHLGVLLELLLIAANIGTAVVLYPVLKRQSEALSLGFVTARIVESVFIAAGILCVLAIVSLGHDDPGAGSLAVSLAATKDGTFLLGPGVVEIGNGLILGWLLLRSGLVPRRMALLGVVGGPVLLASGIAVLFGVVEAGGIVQSLATVPEFLWELSLGVYLTVQGLARPSAGRGAAAPADPRPVTA
ncbi:DUF4386 domain-containing protein [Miltoncostaea oceani]|uniref:DUF4386 domain-containing protein n=1 Tax=Miltoncostaea oceani TaxID=2843216 RepID=UPI001C3DDA1B|nr:DUF4386 domain-containing protein [Miltoncostaea oceani]